MATRKPTKECRRLGVMTPTRDEALPSCDGKQQKESVSAGDVSRKSTIKCPACVNE